MRVAVLSDIHADLEALERATVALAGNHDRCRRFPTMSLL
jgi:hypothetical protein